MVLSLTLTGQTASTPPVVAGSPTESQRITTLEVEVLFMKLKVADLESRLPEQDPDDYVTSPDVLKAKL